MLSFLSNLNNFKAGGTPRWRFEGFFGAMDLSDLLPSFIADVFLSDSRHGHRSHLPAGNGGISRFPYEWFTIRFNLASHPFTIDIILDWNRYCVPYPLSFIVHRFPLLIFLLPGLSIGLRHLFSGSRQIH